MITILLAPAAATDASRIELDDEETRHLQVRRVQDGEPVTALNGAGAVVHGLLRKGIRRWEVEVHRVERVPEHPATTIAVAAGDRDRFMWVAEKCTEMRVTRIIPLVTSRQHNVENRLREAGVEKAQKRAREACKQCGNAWAPVVDDITSFGQLPAAPGWHIADAAGGRLGRVGARASVSWIIGPEGGFTADEMRLATDTLGATPITFGPTVLRFETAAVAAAALTLDRRAAGRAS